MPKATGVHKSGGVDVTIIAGALLQEAADTALKAHNSDELNAVYPFMAAVIEMGGPAAELIKWGEDLYGYHLCLDYLQEIVGCNAPPKPNVGRRVEAASGKNDGGGQPRRDAHTNLAASVANHGQKNPSAAYIKVHTMLGKTVYDTFKTGDGKSWGDVGAHELHAYHRDGKTAEIFLKAVTPILSTAKDSEKTKPLRELLSEKDFEACVRKAKKGV